jgi:hypothetical protein
MASRFIGKTSHRVSVPNAKKPKARKWRRIFGFEVDFF